MEVELELKRVRAAAGKSWRGTPAALLCASLVFVYFLLLPDKSTLHLLNVVVWCTIAFAALTDRAQPVARRILPAAILMGVSVTIVAFCGWLSVDHARVWGPLVRYQVLVIWLCVVWLFTPYLICLLDAGSRRRGAVCCSSDRMLVAWVAAAGCFFALQCLVSAVASHDPKTSLKLWGSEIGCYAAVFLILLRFLETDGPPQRWLVHGWFALTLGAIAAMVAVLVLYATIPSAAIWLRTHELIRVEAHDPSAPWRLQFPFSHHNRTGFFAMCSLFFMLMPLAASRPTAGRKIIAKALGILGAAGAGACLVFTMTRGALIGAAVGLLVWFAGTLIAGGLRKWMAVLVLVPLLIVLLPSGHRRQLMQIISPTSYHAGIETTIGARFITWHDAVGIIRERPGLGVGYGFENFERVYDRKHSGSSESIEGISHAHNQWLEIAAECGIPAAVVFAGFTILRLGVLFLCWLRTLRRGQSVSRILLLVLALETAIQLYGLTNYSLRRGLGFLTYGIWAWGLALALRESWQAQEPPAR